MKVADPAAYDQIKVLTTTTAFSDGFRAIYATHTGAVTVSLAVTQITNGSPVIFEKLTTVGTLVFSIRSPS
jgi:hypothetical protein